MKCDRHGKKRQEEEEVNDRVERRALKWKIKKNWLGYLNMDANKIFCDGEKGL